MSSATTEATKAPTTGETTVRVTAGAFTTLLEDALPFAGRDKAMPVICTVRLEVRSGVLRAITTDRFRLAVVTRPADVNGGDTDVLIDRRDAKAIVKAFTPDADAYLRLTFQTGDRETLTVERTGDAEGHPPELTMTITSVKGEYPNYQKLLDDAAATPDAQTSKVAFNPELMADYAKVSDYRQGRRPVRIELCGPGKPIVVRLGEHFYGLLMPVAVGVDSP